MRINFAPIKSKYMTEQIHQTTAPIKQASVGHPAEYSQTQLELTKKTSRRLSFGDTCTVALLLATILLSAWNGFLFFKELLVACAIIGMALLLKALSHPEPAPVKSKPFDPRLN